MPVYEDLPVMGYYPNPEMTIRDMFAGMVFESILDVGAGHGGVFDLERWETDPRVAKKEACDLFWIRDLPPTWKTQTGVDACKLDEFYEPGSFDWVQCCEVLEHIEDSDRALEQLVKVARKAVFITSADEQQHRGPEQAAIEKVNRHQAYVRQPSVATMQKLGFSVRVEEREKRQLIAWLVK